MDKISDVVIKSDLDFQKFFNSEEMIVNCWVYWDKGVPRIYEKEVPNTEKIEFVFRKMTQGLWEYIEDNIVDIFQGVNERETASTYNFNKLRVFIVKFLLKRWNLDIALEHKENGELTDESYKKAISIHSSVMKHCIDKYEETLFLDEETSKKIAVQSALLFSPTGKGVHNPHEAISLYCNLSLFWDKFGLNYFDLQKIPHDIFLYLKTVNGYESDFRNKEQKQHKQSGKHQRQRVA